MCVRSLSSAFHKLSLFSELLILISIWCAWPSVPSSRSLPVSRQEGSSLSCFQHGPTTRVFLSLSHFSSEPCWLSLHIFLHLLYHCFELWWTHGWFLIHDTRFGCHFNLFHGNIFLLNALYHFFSYSFLLLSWAASQKISAGSVRKVSSSWPSHL